MNKTRRRSWKLCLMVALLHMGSTATAWAQDEAAQQPPQAQAPPQATQAPAQPEAEQPAQDTPATDSMAPPPGKDPAFAEELTRFGEAWGRYQSEILDYQTTIDGIVEAEYNRRVSLINARYDRDIRVMEVVERQQREEAIARFQTFVERYPKSRDYAPDALFRLAELYFEKANDDYLLADEEYQAQRQLYDAGRRPDPPEPPERDYSRTVQTFRQLIANWPDYRQIDGAYYLLAYCEQQMDNPEVARDLFAELIAARPDSRFANEAWLRIAEFHFENPEIGTSKPADGLKLARDAYQRVVSQGSEGPLYDKALYKLAWTHFRLDDYDSAIKHFQQLVEFSDEMQRRTGRSGAALREEAIQYMAISLAEGDWNLDGLPDRDFGLERARRYLPGEQPYEREVLQQLADFFFERQAFNDAIAILEYIVDRYPMHPENPVLHEKIVTALHRDQKPDRAFALRRALADLYGPGSAWYAHQEQKNEQAALRRADNLLREYLIDAAVWFHEQAQKLASEARTKRSVDLLKQAEDRYRVAASAYADFLNRYPDDRNVFEWNFYYAECLYFSRQYAPAFLQYQVVRELDIKNNEFQERSAFNAIKSLENTMEEMVRRGELTPRAMMGLKAEDARAAAQQQEKRKAATGDQRNDQLVVIQSEPIPAEVNTFVTAMDRYVVLGLKNPTDSVLDAKFAFQAARVYYNFKHYDEARKRFEWIVNNYSDQEVAYFSASLIIETFLEEKNYPMLAVWAEKLSGVMKGDQAAAIQAEIKQFQLGALFKSAEALYAEKKFEEAAAEYMRLVTDSPDHPYAPKAMYNAAVAYETIKRFDTAMRLYKQIFEKFPKEPLAASALYRVAVNSEKFFDFDEAVRHYLLFFDQYRTRPLPELKADMGFDVEAKRLDALRSAAVLLERQQRYEEAAPAYVKFVRSYPADPTAADVLWQAALVWEKAKKPKNMIETLQQFNREYGARTEQNYRVFEGMMKIADHYEKTRDQTAAARWYSDIIAEFQKRGLAPASPEAFFPAKAKFMLNEQEFDKWQKIKITGNLEKQKKLLQDRINGQKALTDAYLAVMNYRSLEWTMAANFRIGTLFQNFAYALFEVPIPFKEDSDEYFVYQEQLEALAIPLEEKAVEAFVKTIERARQEKIVNEWTKRTLVELNKYKSAEYPLFKEERRALLKRSRSGLPLLDVDGYEELKRREAPKSSEDAP